MTMRTYLGLGSNLGDRRANLAKALDLLTHRPLTVERVSPVVESPALLPDDAPADWNLPFLNLAVACESDASPKTLLAWCKEIEQRLGRTPGPRWSPRPMDIDILLWGDEQWLDESLTIPHPGLRERNFVLTPMVALQPRLVPPGANGENLLECSRRLSDPIPLWMGIVNVTPDSFSDGGRFTDWSGVEPLVRDMLDAGVHIIDVGGESTRPGAQPLQHEEEWARVAPVLEQLLELRAGNGLAARGKSPASHRDRRGARLTRREEGEYREYLTDEQRSQPGCRAGRMQGDFCHGLPSPYISIDTYHADTARRALELGVDMVNDVSGLASPAMIELAGESSADWVAMHQLSLPVDPNLTLAAGRDPFTAVEEWLRESLERWDKAGLDLNRIIFDPGIGFGKTAHQSWELLRRAGEFRQHGLRVLVGHSRKSFLRPYFGNDMQARERATVGVSLDLCDQGVDIVRVHDVPLNMDAFRGWALARRA